MPFEGFAEGRLRLITDTQGRLADRKTLFRKQSRRMPQPPMRQVSEGRRPPGSCISPRRSSATSLPRGPARRHSSSFAARGGSGREPRFGKKTCFGPVTVPSLSRKTIGSRILPGSYRAEISVFLGDWFLSCLSISSCNSSTASRMMTNRSPNFVNLYSTRGGISG
jgi:hypothetical protein